jgi:murein DD-endopeptidase MepM/ murein hydrolase activator NlpD
MSSKPYEKPTIMKQSILLFIALSVSSISISQTGQYEPIMITFQKNFNDNNGQAVFDMMNPVMQHSISLKQITSIIDTYYTNFGKMVSFEFTKREDVVEVFLCRFERGEHNILIVADTEEKLSGLLFKPYEDGKGGKLERNMTQMQLPFKGEWFTFWGGDTKRQNYHVAYKPQQGAFDFIVLDKDDKSYERSGTRNEDYYAFGKPIYAVCDALVYKVITGVEDNRPTIMNPAQTLGNSVVLFTENEEYIFYAHFQKGSIKVKKGDLVKKGQYLGNCGNSGNSSEAHLHLHIQDGPNVMADTGARCFFEELIVNGELLKDYSPVKGDRISMPEE